VAPPDRAGPLGSGGSPGSGGPPGGDGRPEPTEPPFVPLRHSRWPARKSPRWLILAGLVVLACAVLVGVAVQPSQAQRATDMNGFLHDMTADIQSCAGGVRESLTVLRAINAGTSHDRATAIGVASYGAGNCSPANNELLDELVQYQVHESLAAYQLDRAVKGLVTWAFPDAQRVQADVAAVLRASGAARAAAAVKLQQALRRLDGQRAYVDGILRTAATETHATIPIPSLPG
jgi:hypothetical protein